MKVTAGLSTKENININTRKKKARRDGMNTQNSPSRCLVLTVILNVNLIIYMIKSGYGV